MLKEALRSIYATASNALEARAAFRRWATLAAATGSRELVATRFDGSFARRMAFETYFISN